MIVSALLPIRQPVRRMDLQSIERHNPFKRREKFSKTLDEL